MTMQLKKLTVQGFRSVKKEEALRVDDKITILIGANDHGKSNLLDAIQCLNDERKLVPDDDNWDLPANGAAVLCWHFKPDQELMTELQELEIKPQPIAVALLDVTPTDAEVAAAATVPAKPVEEVKSLPLNNEGEIVYVRDSRLNEVKVASLPFKIPVSNEADVLKLRPRVELFSPPTNNLTDEISLAELTTDSFEFMQGIFRLAGLWDMKDTIFAQTDKNSKLLDEASVRLTTILNDKWKQGNDLKWKFEYTGTKGDHVVIKILDPSINAQYTRPSLRSSGFKTYFLLSMIIYARTQKTPSRSYIYLFDEPGTYLHPQAQLDLQKSFEAIADKSQLVYTTHSLFLINKNYPDRNRVISKTKAGTEIDQKPFVKNWKSVRESLGILLSNNFLIAEKTLLVEGPSDVIYLIDAIKKLKQEGKIDVDLNDLSIVDAGSSENYVAMAKLMLSEGRAVVAVMDGDKAGENLETQLNKTCQREVKQKKLQIRRLPSGKSTEDIFCDLEVLKEATKRVANNLIAGGVRTIAANVNLDQKVAGIRPSEGKTLGKVIDDETTTWFDPNEKLSKLSVALEYETVGSAGKVAAEAQRETEAIRDLLKLKGEKSMEQGVFEEIA